MVFLYQKISTDHKSVENNNQEKFTISHFSHMGNFSVLIRLRQDFAIKKLVG